MAQNITVLLIEDSPDYAELVQQWLTNREQLSFTLNWTDTLEAGIRRLAQGGIDVVLMDLGLEDSQGIETFLKLHPHTSGVPVIVLSAAESESLAIQTVQEGAQDYLVKSACNAEMLVRAVRYAMLRQRKQRQEVAAGAAGPRTKTIGVLSAGGGAGTTTIACHLAVEIRRQTAQRVLLADLDMNSGMISFLMKLDSAYSILDGVHNLHRLDEDIWNGLVSRAADGVEVIGSPVLLGKSEPNGEAVGHVLGVVRSYYDWIVVDLGRISSFVAGVMDKMDEILLVTSGEVAALYQARRLVQGAPAAIREADRFRVVLNHVADGMKLSGRDMEKIFGIPLYATLPHDLPAVRTAQTQGRLLTETSALRQRIAELARKIAGLDEKKSKRWTSLAKLNPFNGKREAELQTAQS